tara:strand:+ start:425 stop:775 length:351 start_codon:yes stop_codon:yes gene_type:complete
MKTISRTISIDDDEGIEAIAKEIGIQPAEVRQTMYFSVSIHEEIRERELSFNQTIAGVMSVVADLLKHHVPLLDRAELATNIYKNLWESCDLPSDVSAPAWEASKSEAKVDTIKAN